MKIGFIGIGQMGYHMAEHILDAGYDLSVHDIRKEAAAPLLQKGARWSGTPGEMAQSCQLVFSSLPAPQDVEEVVYGINGLKSGWKSGDIFVDMSTNSPTTIRKVSGDAAAMGVAVLDAPVSGGTGGARMGTLAIMVGGEAAVLEKIRKILETMGKKIFYAGDIGCGNIAKLVNNLISLTATASTAEGFVLGVKAGIDPQVLWDIIRMSTGNCWALEQMPGSVFKGNFEPGFKLSLGRKDMGLALKLGEEFGVPLTLGKATQQGLSAALAAGYAEKSVQAVILPLEEKTGIKVRISE